MSRRIRRVVGYHVVEQTSAAEGGVTSRSQSLIRRSMHCFRFCLIRFRSDVAQVWFHRAEPCYRRQQNSTRGPHIVNTRGVRNMSWWTVKLAETFCRTFRSTSRSGKTSQTSTHQNGRLNPMVVAGLINEKSLRRRCHRQHMLIK